VARTTRLRGAAAPTRRFVVHALPDIIGVVWVVCAGVAVLVPALAHGASLGPFDQLSRYGLSQRPGTVVHYRGPGDQIEMLIPWTSLAWTQVHHGHLPLWNPYSALGMPLLFNWQSAAFSLPTLIGYLLPLRLAYTAVQIVTVVVAGTGAYVFGRVLRLGVMGATTAAVVFELSGPFVGWLGWPNSSAMSWAGWLFAAAVLIVRGRRRAGAVALFAVSLAFSVYAGQPETVVLFAVALVIFVAVLLAGDRSRRGGPRPILRPVGDLAAAAAAGGALAAPLALPGLQLARGSVVRVASSYGALAPHNLANLLFQGFDGLPVAGSRYFGSSIYPETALYVGGIAVVLAVVALSTRWRRPEVPALAACAVVMAAVAYVGPVVSVINAVTGLRSVAWHRSVQPLVFALAVLAGVGMDAVARAGRSAPVWRALLAGFGALGLVLAGLWAAGRGHLPSDEASIRAGSFLWPLIETALGLAVAGALVVAARRARRPEDHDADSAAPRPRRGGFTWATAVLLGCETAFLVTAGAPLASSSPTFATPTPAERVLARDVGGALVAFSSRECHTPPTLGIHQDINVVYGVHELADFDPMVPEATFRSFQRATGQHAAAIDAPLILCPAVDSAVVARQYGVGFILTQGSAPAPAGTRFVAAIAGERLYRVPSSSLASLSPAASPAGSGSGNTATHQAPAVWVAPDQLAIRTAAPTESVLHIGITAVPGWDAAIDGHPLSLGTLAGTMLQARVPPGRHVVTLTYRPTAFTVGLVLAVLSMVGLLAVPATATLRRRRAVRRERPRHALSAGDAPPPTSPQSSATQ
jgi:hypothetical protein